MMGPETTDAPGAAGQPLFATTHWSVVLAAANEKTSQAAEALEQLCLTYWGPLYVYARRRGYGPEDSQDLTQGFLADFLNHGAFDKADPARGRFRTFLLKSFQHFLADDWKKTHRIKRGGGNPPISLDAQTAEERYCLKGAETTTPERAYERRWALTLLEEVLAGMRRDYAQAGKSQQFAVLQEFLWGTDESTSYARVAAELQLTEGAARVAVHRLRVQYRQRLRAQVAQIVSEPNQIDEELRYLIEVMS
jgi:RNA polymerase sigma factor (sigma-70 family)